MKASKFTDAQKAFIIKQDEDGTPVAEIFRKAGISQASYFNWKKKYAGPMPSEMRRLRQTTGRRNASPPWPSPTSLSPSCRGQPCRPHSPCCSIDCANRPESAVPSHIDIKVSAYGA